MKRTTLYYVLLASGLAVCSMRQAAALDNPPACPGVKFAEDCPSNGQPAGFGVDLVEQVCPDSDGNTAVVGSSFWNGSIGISLEGAHAFWGQVQGVGLTGLIASCKATDTTVDGTSATDTTGCGAFAGIQYRVRNCY